MEKNNRKMVLTFKFVRLIRSKLKGLFLRINLNYLQNIQIINMGIMIIMSISLNLITGSIALSFSGNNEVIEEVILDNGLTITYKKDGTTIFTYPDGEEVKGYPMAYPKEGPFYSRDKEFAEMDNENNSTCEDADYHQSPDKTANFNTPDSVNLENPPLSQVDLTMFSPEERQYLEEISLLDFDAQVLEICVHLYDKVVDSIQSSTEENVNVKVAVTQCLLDDITRTLWGVNNPDDTVNQIRVAQIVETNYRTIQDNLDLNIHEKKILAHINVQITLIHLSSIKNIPPQELLDNTELYNMLHAKQGQNISQLQDNEQQ